MKIITLLITLLFSLHLAEGSEGTKGLNQIKEGVERFSTQMSCGKSSQEWRERFSLCDCKAYGGLAYVCDLCEAFSQTAEGGEIPSPGTINFLMTVSEDVTLDGIKVSLNSLEHTWANDLTATLITPWDEEIVLFSKVPTDSDYNGNYAFFDAASINLYQATPDNGVIPPGTYLAASSINNNIYMNPIVNGSSSSGTWTLRIHDNFLTDGGSTESWTLTFYPLQTCASIDLTDSYTLLNLTQNGAIHNIQYDNNQLVIEKSGDYEIVYTISGDVSSNGEDSCSSLSSAVLNNESPIEETYSSVPIEDDNFVSFSNTSIVSLQKGDRIGLGVSGTVSSNFTPRAVSMTAVLLN